MVVQGCTLVVGRMVQLTDNSWEVTVPESRGVLNLLPDQRQEEVARVRLVLDYAAEAVRGRNEVDKREVGLCDDLGCILDSLQFPPWVELFPSHVMHPDINPVEYLEEADGKREKMICGRSGCGEKAGAWS